MSGGLTINTAYLPIIHLFFPRLLLISHYWELLRAGPRQHNDPVRSPSGLYLFRSTAPLLTSIQLVSKFQPFAHGKCIKLKPRNQDYTRYGLQGTAYKEQELRLVEFGKQIRNETRWILPIKEQRPRCQWDWVPLGFSYE